MRCFLAAGCVLGLVWCSWANAWDDGHPPDLRSVTIDVVIASGPREAGQEEMTAAALLELAGAGKLDWVTRLRLATVDNERVQVQVGERAPVVTGRMSRGGFGGEAVQTMVSIGTTVEAIPQVVADGSIVVALTAEKSWLEPAAPAAEGGEDPQPPPLQRTSTLSAKSTVHVKAGEPTLVAAQSSSAGKSGVQTWIVLTAQASAPSRSPAVAEAREELKIFHLKFAVAADAAKVLSVVFDNHPVRIAVDARTNSLLISGAPGRMATVEAVLQQIDQQAPAEK